MKKEAFENGLYIITNNVNKKVYVGSSTTLSKRLYNHYGDLKRGAHRNLHLQAAYNKYGKENFTHIVIEVPLDKDLEESEQNLLNQYLPNVYNKALVVKERGWSSTGNPVYLLDLEGNVVQKFLTGNKLATFFGKRQLTYSIVNTKRTFQKKYRVVTEDFYNTSFDIIKSWKSYTSETVYKSKKFHALKFKIVHKSQEYYFKNASEAARFMEMTPDNLRKKIKKMVPYNFCNFIFFNMERYYFFILNEDLIK